MILALLMLAAACGLVRCFVTARPEPFSFPTTEPRGPVHLQGDRTTAELLKALRPGQQPLTLRVVSRTRGAK